MEIRQILRLIVFGYFSFLPNFLSFWPSTVLPEIIEKNLMITSKEDHSKYGGYFFTSYFTGLIVGCFCWPYLIRLLSKRMALLLGLFFQGVFTYLTGCTLNMPLFFLLRFLTGFSNNINTIGKDFIFEFTKPEYRQYAFSIKSSFTMLGMWVGPLLGYLMYVYFDRSFSKSLAFLAVLYMIACLLFIIFFYLDFTPLEFEMKGKVSISLHDIQPDSPVENQIEDEEKALVRPERKHKKKSKGLWEVVLIIWKRPVLRNYVLVYLLTNGIGTTRSVLMVFLLEGAWSEGGLNVSAMSISFTNLIVFVCSLAFLMIAPIFVPSRIEYMTIIRQIVFLMILFNIAMPFTRDVLSDSNGSNLMIILTCYGVMSFLNPKLFSPFLNFLFNDKIEAEARTSMNSITFVGSCIAASLSMTLIAPFYSISTQSQFFQNYAPFSKYLCFVLMDLVLLVCFFLLGNKKHENGF